MKNNKSNSKLKIVLVCITPILLFIAYKVFSIFVWQVAVAERELLKYANEIHGQDEAIVCEYDWYNGRYVATNNPGFVLDYRRQNRTIHDESFGLKESEKASLGYKALIRDMPDSVSFPEDVTVWTEISADDYNLKAQRLYLLGVYNTKGLSEQESLSMPAKITMEIVDGLGKDFNFTGIQTIYFDKNGMFEISLPADSFEAISMEKLLDHIDEKSADDHPETYIHWLKENHFI